MTKTAHFRFYEELNDFLPKARKKSTFLYEFSGSPAVKDAIEANGVPHTEIDLILVGGESVAFAYRLKDGDRVAVYPVFESLDITPVTHLRPEPLREPKFILDVHLGKLAHYLRIFGFDSKYDNRYKNAVLAANAKKESRIILTRDVNLLKCKSITHGYRVRSQKPETQLVEVLKRFDLKNLIRPLSRCIVCNGDISKVSKKSISHRLKPKTREYYEEFYRCDSCRNIYWKGSHYQKMERFISRITNNWEDMIAQ